MSEQSPKPMMVVGFPGYLHVLDELTEKHADDYAVIIGQTPSATDIAVDHHPTEGVITIGDFVFPERVFSDVIPGEWDERGREFATDLMGARLFERDAVNPDGYAEAFTLSGFREYAEGNFREFGGFPRDGDLADAPHVVVTGHFHPTGDYRVMFPEGEDHQVGEATYPATAFQDGGGANALMSGHNVLAGTTVFPRYAIADEALAIADAGVGGDGEPAAELWGGDGE